MAISGKQRIGTLLLHAGKIDEDQLQKGLQIQKEKDGYLGQAFVELGFLNNKELNKRSKYIKGLIGKQITSKNIPDIKFYFDDSIEYYDKIDRIFLDLDE